MIISNTSKSTRKNQLYESVKGSKQKQHIKMLLTINFNFKKNPRWSRTSVDDHDLTARTLFTEGVTDEELWFLQQTIV